MDARAFRFGDDVPPIEVDWKCFRIRGDVVDGGYEGDPAVGTRAIGLVCEDVRAWVGDIEVTDLLSQETLVLMEYQVLKAVE